MVQLALETLLSNDKKARDVRDAQEIFHMAETIGLEVSLGRFGIDLRLMEALVGHRKVTNRRERRAVRT